MPRIVYDKEIYYKVATEQYLNNLSEYQELRAFLQREYECDINRDEFIKCEIVNEYIVRSQLDETEAKNTVSSKIDNYFEVNDYEKQKIMMYLKKISDKMPQWNNGGKLDIDVTDIKVGRNEICPCGSGKKYKKCCGK